MSSSNNGVNNVKSHNGHESTDFEEVRIPVPWGYISGMWFGPINVQPIIAIHGWQDNAGTFLRLVPMLPKDVSVLCIDLPGHGYSTHLPQGQSYYIFWDGVVFLRRIVKHYKWDKIKLLGHSLGGAISFLYAASYPDEVKFVISLDIVSPSVKKVTSTASTTGDHIDKFLKFEKLTLDSVPCYEYKEIIDIVEDAYKGGITRGSAEILMKRGMQPALIPGKHYFSSDPRLKVSLLGMISMDLVMAYASQIKCAYMNIRAKPEVILDHPENYQKVLDVIKLGARKFEYHEVEGTHHVHLNNPELVAPLINAFLESL